MAATNNIFPRLSRRTSAMVLIGVMCIAIAVLVLINIFAPDAPADQDIPATQEVTVDQDGPADQDVSADQDIPADQDVPANQDIPVDQEAD